MKNTATVLLAIAVGTLGVFAYRQNTALRREQRQISELGAKLEPASDVTRLDLEAKCANQAREFLSQFDNRNVVETQSHYNAGLNKCFVETRAMLFSSGNHTESKVVTDAFEGRDYASYIFVSKPKEADWQVAPVECKVTLPSGKEALCHSLDEFDALVNQYMQ